MLIRPATEVVDADDAIGEVDQHDPPVVTVGPAIGEHALGRVEQDLVPQASAGAAFLSRSSRR